MVLWSRPVSGVRGLLFILLVAAVIGEAFAATPLSPEHAVLQNLSQDRPDSSRQRKQELILGVFPHLPPSELEKVYAPIAARLSEALGRKVKFSSSSSYRKFMAKLDQQAFDIVMVQPFDYVHIADTFGYLPVATRDEPLATIVVVPESSPLTDLNSLKGRKVALPPKVAAVSRLLEAELKDHGLQPTKDVFLSYHRSHMSCLQQMVIGTVDACATAIFQQQDASQCKDYRREPENPSFIVCRESRNFPCRSRKNFTRVAITFQHRSRPKVVKKGQTYTVCSHKGFGLRRGATIYACRLMFHGKPFTKISYSCHHIFTGSGYDECRVGYLIESVS
jgi:hypothetical protein